MIATMKHQGDRAFMTRLIGVAMTMLVQQLAGCHGMHDKDLEHNDECRDDLDPRKELA